MPSAWAVLAGGGTVLTWLTSSGISRTGGLMIGWFLAAPPLVDTPMIIKVMILF